jgi:hypothetical protein
MKKFINKTILLLALTIMIMLHTLGAYATTNTASGVKGQITITCDNEYTLFFNGEKVGSGNKWYEANVHRLNISKGKNVIAIKAIDHGYLGGLLADIEISGQRFVTNNSWKVRTVEEANWNKVNYDAKNWRNAFTNGVYGVSPWGRDIKGMKDDTKAFWIWSDRNTIWSSENDKTVYFRYELKDTTPPKITLNGQSTVYVNQHDTYSELGAKATDNFDGILKVSASKITTSIPGNYTVNYSATDSSGNTSKLTRNVVVRKPLISVEVPYRSGSNKYKYLKVTTTNMPKSKTGVIMVVSSDGKIIFSKNIYLIDGILMSDQFKVGNKIRVNNSNIVELKKGTYKVILKYHGVSSPVFIEKFKV